MHQITDLSIPSMTHNEEKENMLECNLPFELLFGLLIDFAARCKNNKGDASNLEHLHVRF
jgi:hypothetical protein